MPTWVWLGPLIWAGGMLLLVGLGLILRARERRGRDARTGWKWLERFGDFLTWFP